jgi:hypothetical protein
MNINPMEAMSKSLKLIKAINNKESIKILIVKPKKMFRKAEYGFYSFIPNAYTYKDGTFFVECNLNNIRMKVPFGKFIKIENQLVGAFETQYNCKVEFNDFIETADKVIKREFASIQFDV